MKQTGKVFHPSKRERVNGVAGLAFERAEDLIGQFNKTEYNEVTLTRR